MAGPASILGDARAAPSDFVLVNILREQYFLILSKCMLVPSEKLEKACESGHAIFRNYTSNKNDMSTKITITHISIKYLPILID